VLDLYGKYPYYKLLGGHMIKKTVKVQSAQKKYQKPAVKVEKLSVLNTDTIISSA